MLAAETAIIQAYDTALDKNAELQKQADLLAADRSYSPSRKALGMQAVLRATWDDDTFRQKLLAMDPGPGYSQNEASGSESEED